MTPTLAVSPLSPERACAMSSRRTFIETTSTLVLHDASCRQRGPVGDDLLDLRAAAGEAGDTRRAIEHERRDLAREALDRRAVVAAHADAKLHFREHRALRRRRAARASQTRRRTR